MAKITLTDLVNLQNETTAVNAINANSAAIETAFENTLSRDGTVPNTMSADLDMNSNQIINLPAPGTLDSPARLRDVVTDATIASVPPIGTSGSVVGLLNTNNTHSGNNTFSGSNTFSTSNTLGGTTTVNNLTANGTTTLGTTTISAATLSGTPFAPTAAVHTNTTQIANTGFVVAEILSRQLKVQSQVFTANGTYTPTSGMIYCIIECVGGGGAGGGVAGSASNSGCGAGGGGGSYSRKICTAADIGASKTVTIGTGGTAGAAGANAGNAGSDTSVGSLCIGKGGSGGGGTTAASLAGVGGQGGVAGTGDTTTLGNCGNSGFALAGQTFSLYGATGGGSYFGGASAGLNAAGSGTVAGTAGRNYGGGGSGAATSNSAANQSGGAGANGIAVITEYIITP